MKKTIKQMTNVYSTSCYTMIYVCVKYIRFQNSVCYDELKIMHKTILKMNGLYLYYRIEYLPEYYKNKL